MTQRIVETEYDRKLLVRFIQEHKLPMTVNVQTGGKRSVQQNRLNRLWMNEISEQMDGWTPEYTRGYCKLTIGVPILRAENEEFCERYDQIVKPMPYETKMDLMCEPLDFPVTRLMTVSQQAKYLDQVNQHFAEKGLVLTDPDDLLKQSRNNSNPDPAQPPREDQGHAEDEGLASDPSAEDGGGGVMTGSAPSPSIDPRFKDAVQQMLAVPLMNSLLEDQLSDLTKLKDFWKGNLNEDCHDKLAALFSTTQAVLKGHETRKRALDYYAGVLKCDVSELETNDGL